MDAPKCLEPENLDAKTRELERWKFSTFNSGGFR